MRIVPGVLLLAITACAQSAPPAEVRDVQADVERALEQALGRIAELSDSIDDLLQPVRLLTPAEQSTLRQYGNAEHLARARALGARPADSTQLAALSANGRLVQLEDTTALWAVRELEHSLPLVTPDARALLTRIAQKFQQGLEEMGLPPYRLEITSVLRTGESQAELRQTNQNAAAGTSTHEFGTTLDIAYSSFAGPLDPELGVDVSDVPWLEPHVHRIGSVFLETVAARKSRELQALLGRTLLEFQRSGDVYVTLERQQPVYHITVARPQS